MQSVATAAEGEVACHGEEGFPYVTLNANFLQLTCKMLFLFILLLRKCRRLAIEENESKGTPNKSNRTLLRYTVGYILIARVLKTRHKLLPRGFCDR